MFTIEYSPTGVPISDTEAEKFVLEFIEQDVKEIAVSTANVIYAARALSLEKGFSIQFKFEGKVLVPNEYGAIHDWPKGFCNKEGDWAARVLKFAVEKRKKERAEGKPQPDRYIL